MRYGETSKGSSTPILASSVRVESKAPVKITDGNLIKMEDDPRVYVISNSQRRLIPDEETFLGLGYDWSNIMDVSERVLRMHKIGDPLSL